MHAVAYNSYNDKELIALLKQSDQHAYIEIYDRYKRPLFLHACKIIRDKDLAEEFVQEMFVYLWDKRLSLNIQGSVTAYLYNAVRYKFFDWVDKQKVRSDYVQAFQSFIDRGEHVTDNYIFEKELQAIIDDEIARFPEKMRQIFHLSRKEHLSNNEIAEYLNISEKTVRNQLSNALRILRTRLGVIAALCILLHR